MLRTCLFLCLCSLPAPALPASPEQSAAQVLPKVLKLLGGPGDTFWQLKSHLLSPASSQHRLLYLSPVNAPGSRSVSFQTLAVGGTAPRLRGTFEWEALYPSSPSQVERDYGSLCAALRKLYPRAPEKDESYAGIRACTWQLSGYQVVACKDGDLVKLDVVFEKPFRPRPLNQLMGEWHQQFSADMSSSQRVRHYNQLVASLKDQGYPRSDLLQAWKAKLTEEKSPDLTNLLVGLDCTPEEQEQLMAALSPEKTAAVRQVARENLGLQTPPAATPGPAAASVSPPVEAPIRVGDYVRYRQWRNSQGKLDQKIYYILSPPDPQANPYFDLAHQYEVVYPLYGGKKAVRDHLSPEEINLMVRVKPEFYLCQQCWGYGHGFQREVHSVGWQQTLDASVYKYEPGKVEVQYVDQYCYPCKGTGWKSSP